MKGGSRVRGIIPHEMEIHTRYICTRDEQIIHRAEDSSARGQESTPRCLRSSNLIEPLLARVMCPPPSPQSD